ncbi:hypothetical protein N7493_007561 [Penicillium malachiteum]|uniref:alcohol dehydrogenase n=1 Tax=Penicillium malachiteum TaxID=1324776 RepID=A0AAD6HHU9_9EURO|nr:hypothetical protein N7493_007561 [Penicillium malachiteum]
MVPQLDTNGFHSQHIKYPVQTNGKTIRNGLLLKAHQEPEHTLPTTQWAQVANPDGRGTFQGDWPVVPKDHCVGGHEGAGYVVQVGSQVHDINIGDAVGIQWLNRTCGRCEFCVAGNQPLCPGTQLSGCHVDGTFQEYCVCKAENAVRIPPGISLEVAAPVLCAGITVYKALLEANVTQGQTVAIVGAGGGLGSLACQYAKAMGYKVLALSSGSSKKIMCLDELGVDYYVDYNSPTILKDVKDVTDGGPHATLIVSSVEEPFHKALQYIRPGGTVVAVGLPPGKMLTNIFAMVTQKVSIKGSYVGNRHETEDALKIMVRAGFKLRSKVVDFRDLTKIYEMMENGEMHGRAVLKIGDREKGISDHLQLSKHAAYADSNQKPSKARPLISDNLQNAIEIAGRDFRSDTVTVPTEAMMHAIVNDATFGDDIYDVTGDRSVNALQDRIVQLTGKEAALFVPSGTMGNQICLRTLLHQPPHTILLDHRAHVQCWETGAIPLLSQATVTGVEPKNGIHLTLDDVRDRIVEENNCKVF